MIQIKMDGMCDGCKHANLKLVCCKHINGTKDWSIRCTHEAACDQMETKTIAQMLARSGKGG